MLTSLKRESSRCCHNIVTSYNHHLTSALCACVLGHLGGLSKVAAQWAFLWSFFRSLLLCWRASTSQTCCTFWDRFWLTVFHPQEACKWVWFFGVPKVAYQRVNTISQCLMGILQLSNHVVQTEEQMTHWDMLNKATKSEFSLSVAVFAAIRSFDA